MGSSLSHGNGLLSWSGGPKYRPFGIESGSQADALEELHITLYLAILWLCRASIARALRVHPPFSQVRNSLSPRAHISQGPTLTA